MFSLRVPNSGKKRAKTAEMTRGRRGPRPKLRPGTPGYMNGGKPMAHIAATLSNNPLPALSPIGAPSTLVTLAPGASAPNQYPYSPNATQVDGASAPSANAVKQKEEEPAMENRLVLCSTEDAFMLQQDICAICGCVGKQKDGRLIACAQCGQCYHPYCVNICITNVILSKGWRCLECTVCEGCGKPHDEARLLLCDDCDISYHIYCLDPPLDEVPKGTWKCKWCVVCVRCQANSPGPGASAQWQKNYTECDPCSSLSTCPTCQTDYKEDELILMCIQCQKWSHAKCDDILTEEDCEIVTDFGYNCRACRATDELPQPVQIKILEYKRNQKLLSEGMEISRLSAMSRRSSLDSPLSNGSSFVTTGTSIASILPNQPLSSITNSPSIQSKPAQVAPPLIKPVQKQFTLDGVCLSESGLASIKALYPEPQKKPRAKRGAKTNVSLGPPDTPGRPAEDDDAFMNDETNSLESMDFDAKDAAKKRQRRLAKVGIGGFSAKQRSRKEDDSIDASELMNEANDPAILMEKPRRKRKTKRKFLLQESYPSFLQDAFFGRSLLDQTKENTGLLEDTMFQSAGSGDETQGPSERSLLKLNAENTDNTSTSVKQNIAVDFLAMDDQSGMASLDDDEFNDPESLRDLLPLPQDLQQDEELMQMLMQEGDSLDKHEQAQKANEMVDSVLLSPSSHFNLENMVESGTFPQMDSKDVEDVFKGVLSPSGATSSDSMFVLSNDPQGSIENSSTSMPTTNNPATGIPLQEGSNNFTNASANNKDRSFGFNEQFTPQFAQPQLQQSHSVDAQIPSTHSVNASNLQHSNGQVSLARSLSEPTPRAEGESDNVSTQGQKSLLKWEADEQLGLMSTISPVLYANMNFPNLRIDYPAWNERMKQISKYWRQLPTDQRQPYLQKARENRATNRMQKQEAVKLGISKNKEEEKWANRTPATVTRQASLSDNFVCNDDNADSSTSLDGSSNFQRPAPRASPMQASGQMYTNMPLNEGASSQMHGNVQTAQMIQVSRVRPPIDPNLIISGAQSTQNDYQIYTAQPSSVSVSGSQQPSTSHIAQISDHAHYQQSPGQFNAPASPYLAQPKTPVPSISPFSPGKGSVDNNRPPSVVNQIPTTVGTPCHPPPSPAQENQGFSPAPTSLSNEPFSPATLPRPASARMIENYSQDPPLTPNSDVPSPYSRPPATPVGPAPNEVHDFQHPSIPSQHSNTSQINRPSSAPYDPYARPPLTPRPNHDSYSFQPSTPRPVQRNVSMGAPSRASATASPDTYSSNSPMHYDSYNKQHSASGLTREEPMEENPRQQANLGRDQLRELLQKQQSRRQMSNEQQTVSQSQPEPVTNMDSNTQFVRPAAVKPHPQNMMRPPGNDGFRPPFPPMQRQRVQNPAEMQLPQSVFRHPGDPRMIARPMDPRMRMPQGQPIRQHQIQWRMQMATHTQQQIVYNRPQQMMHPQMTQATMMQQQQQTNQLGPSGEMIQHQQHNIHQQQIVMQTMGTQSSQNMQGGLVELSLGDIAAVTGDNQKSEDKPIAKMDCSETKDADVVDDTVPGGPEDLDDDELLGLGSDFNILEYADPELDKALGIGGNHSNIFDEHFDELMDKAGEDVKTDKANTDRQIKRDINESNSSSILPPPYPGTVNAPNDGQGPSQAPPSYEQREVLKPATLLDGLVDENKRSEESFFGQDSLLNDQYFESLNPDILADDFGSQMLNRPQMTAVRPPMQHVQPMQQQPQQMIAGQHQQPPYNQQRQMGQWNGGQQANLQHQQSQQMYIQQQAQSQGVMGGNVRMQAQQAMTGQTQMHPQIQVQSSQMMPGQQMQQMQMRPGMINRAQMMQRMPIGSNGKPIAQMMVQQPMPPGQAHPRVMMAPAMNANSSTSGPISQPQTQSQPVWKGKINLLPAPPRPPAEITTEQDKHKLMMYEQWLVQQQNELTEQQQRLETEVGKLRKSKKSLTSRQRQLRKGGTDLSESETGELNALIPEIAQVQKILEQVRKRNRQHNALVQEYRANPPKRPGQPAPSAMQQMSPQQMAGQPMQMHGQVVHASQPGPNMAQTHTGPQMSGQAIPSPAAHISRAPQSPLMSPSPMMHSPVSVQHSPASSMPPASPHIQSPIYPQQSSPLLTMGQSDGHHAPSQIAPGVTVGPRGPIPEDSHHFRGYAQQVNFEGMAPRPAQIAYAVNRPAYMQAHPHGAQQQTYFSPNSPMSGQRRMPPPPPYQAAYQQQQQQSQPQMSMQAQQSPQNISQQQSPQQAQQSSMGHASQQHKQQMTMSQAKHVQMHQMQQQSMAAPMSPMQHQMHVQQQQMPNVQSPQQMQMQQQIVQSQQMQHHGMQYQMQHSPQTSMAQHQTHPQHLQQQQINMQAQSPANSQNSKFLNQSMNQPGASTSSHMQSSGFSDSLSSLHSPFGLTEELKLDGSSGPLGDLDSKDGLSEAKSFSLNFDEMGNGVDNESGNPSPHFQASNEPKQEKQEEVEMAFEENQLLEQASNDEAMEVETTEPMSIFIKQELVDSTPLMETVSSTSEAKNLPTEKLSSSTSMLDQLLGSSGVQRKSPEIRREIRNPVLSAKIQPIEQVSDATRTINAAHSNVASSSSNVVTTANVSSSSTYESISEHKQNVLLKQLLQNCPSADSANPPSSILSIPTIGVVSSLDNKPKVEVPATAINSGIVEQLLKPVTAPSVQPTPPPSSTPPVVVAQTTKEECVASANSSSLSSATILLTPIEQPRPTSGGLLVDQLVKSSSGITVELKPATTNELVIPIVAPDSSSRIANALQFNSSIKSEITITAATSTETHTSTPLAQPILAASPKLDTAGSITVCQVSAANQERKPTYLDLRRAQLEREPTPPPPVQVEADVKPKKKRANKRRDSSKVLPVQSLNQSSAGPSSEQPRKRLRKGSQVNRADDDFEAFNNELLNQLRTLPPIAITEPSITTNMNVCPLPGTSDLNISGTMLRGSFGRAFLPEREDYYDRILTQPNDAVIHNSASPQLVATSSCGYYNQEFSRAQVFDPVSTFERNGSPCEPSWNYLRDADSPDALISLSGSEEDHFEENDNPLQRLRIFNCSSPMSEGGRASPAIPMPTGTDMARFRIAQVRSTPSPDIAERNKENSGLANSHHVNMRSNILPLRESGNVAVTLTLSSNEDIKMVLSGLARLLDIKPLNQFEVRQNGQLRGISRVCFFCDIVPGQNGITRRVMGFNGPEELYFCSVNCYMQFNNLRNTPINMPSSEELKIQTITRVKEQLPALINNQGTKTDTIIHFDRLPPMSPMMEEDELSGVGSATPPTDSADAHKLTLHSEASSGMGNTTNKVLSEGERSQPVSTLVPLKMQWRGSRYKLFNRSMLEFRQTDQNVSNLLKEQEPPQLNALACVRPANLPADRRQCAFCTQNGDAPGNGAGRLLNLDVDRWVHLNCALWSHEVYETLNGALIHVPQAVTRASSLACVRCTRFGASLHCFKQRCVNTYHFSCAQSDNCAFFKDKSFFCHAHAPRGASPIKQLHSFEVSRRVYVSRDEQQQLASMVNQLDEQHIIRIGSLTFLTIGQMYQEHARRDEIPVRKQEPLVFSDDADSAAEDDRPRGLQAFHSATSIYPVGFKTARYYWSMRQLHKRCRYMCSIREEDARPEFVVEIDEPGEPKIAFRGRTPKQVWQKILTPIKRLRENAGCIKLFVNYLTGEDLFGLNEPSVVRVLESLPGVELLADYKPRYLRNQLLELPLALNPTGCARTEPRSATRPYKRVLQLQHCGGRYATAQSVAVSTSESQSPYQKQFVHSKSSQYRKMKNEWRNNVYLARSRIAGLGLYAARDIEKHTMIIEYIGQLIRNEIAEKNERLYEKQNRRGIYMFRLDENRVVDATLLGGLARYVNHSCDPNCVAEIVQIDRENKILIIANRRISRGEELCYDYRFEMEDDSRKIACMCGAPKCRKWMN